MSNKIRELLDLSGQKTQTISLGHGNKILVHQIVAILGATSLPVKRLRERAAEQNMLIDATAGRKTKSVIITESRYVFLSSVTPQLLDARLGQIRTDATSRLEWEHGEFAS